MNQDFSRSDIAKIIDKKPNLMIRWGITILWVTMSHTLQIKAYGTLKTSCEGVLLMLGSIGFR